MNKAFRIVGLFLIAVMLIGNSLEVRAQNQKSPSANKSKKKVSGVRNHMA